MHISQKGIDLIKSFEGCSLKAYRLTYKGVTEKYLTIGYGHYGPDVQEGQTLTKQQAEDLLRRDLALRFEPKVAKYDHIYHWTQSEFDAMVSYAYNVGSIKKLTEDGKRSKEEIAEDLPNHDTAGGVHFAGLKRRRLAEQQLFREKEEAKNMNNPFSAGQQFLGGQYTQFTPSGKSLLERKERFHKDPRVGDIIYFYISAIKRVGHVGIVAEVSQHGKYYKITTVEGNTSMGNGFSRNGGGVQYKNYTFTLEQVGGANHINGFCTPVFGSDTTSVETFVGVARGEVGYLEKASNASLDSKTANTGTSNYTKYGEWMKQSKLGQNGVYWCQQFVSWCAYKACQKHLTAHGSRWEFTGSYWHYYQDGKMATDGWKQISGRWYAFDAAGNMIIGWFKSGDDWYYMNPEDGTMISGQWVYIGQEAYYLTASGIMAKSAYVKDASRELYYWVDADGNYQKQWDTESPDLMKYQLEG